MNKHVRKKLPICDRKFATFHCHDIALHLLFMMQKTYHVNWYAHSSSMKLSSVRIWKQATTRLCIKKTWWMNKKCWMIIFFIFHFNFKFFTWLVKREWNLPQLFFWCGKSSRSDFLHYNFYVYHEMIFSAILFWFFFLLDFIDIKAHCCIDVYLY